VGRSLLPPDFKAVTDNLRYPMSLVNKIPHFPNIFLFPPLEAQILSEAEEPRPATRNTS
jgi:hypothetical protein